MQACVGLIGGLAVGASCQYYKRLSDVFRQQNRMLRLVLVHADLPTVLRHMTMRNREAFVGYMAGFTAQLNAAGASNAVITSVASHYGFDELAARSELPLISILEATRRKIDSEGFRRIALFGSRFAMETSMYGSLEGSAEIVRLTEEEMHAVNQIYMDLAERGFAVEGAEERLTALAESVRKRERLDSIVLAGTDFSVMFDDHRSSFPYLDCTDVHVEAISRDTLHQEAA